MYNYDECINFVNDLNIIWFYRDSNSWYELSDSEVFECESSIEALLNGALDYDNLSQLVKYGLVLPTNLDVFLSDISKKYIEESEM
jgi:hypothetical protein